MSSDTNSADVFDAGIQNTQTPSPGRDMQYEWVGISLSYPSILKNLARCPEASANKVAGRVFALLLRNHAKPDVVYGLKSLVCQAISGTSLRGTVPPGAAAGDLASFG